MCDAIIIGSGAGGAAAAYQLTKNGAKVLLIERGQPIPTDGSTLDVKKVGQGLCRLHENWLDRHGKSFSPHEYLSVGGKTKWYGAALLRLPADEFKPDAEHGLLGWPLSYAELEPFYAEAEKLLAVRTFDIEPDLKALAAAIQHSDARWQASALPLGLSEKILKNTEEARHFDGYASPLDLKSDAQSCLLNRVADNANLNILTGRRVTALLGAPGQPQRVIGVTCDDGSSYFSKHVLLAAGALNSPRILYDYAVQNRLQSALPGYAVIGRNYKCHLNTVVLALSVTRKTDLLRKTLLLRHADFPHSSAQTLGWLDGAILGNELPAWTPRWCADLLASRAYGFFLTSEDGSHADNRIKGSDGTVPTLDYDPARRATLLREHMAFVSRFRSDLLKRGYVCVSKSMPLAASAHACGTLVAGSDPALSVVNAEGRVHGMENMYVVDGSVLPRSGSVNPALTIYAWALRCANKISIRNHDA
jgi:choline dehydrogenase-like flavoprotein